MTAGELASPAKVFIYALLAWPALPEHIRAVIMAAGNDVAMNDIGVLYQNDLGVAQDYAKAREWFKKAAAGNDAAAAKFARKQLAKLAAQGH